MASNSSNPDSTRSWLNPGSGIVGNYNPNNETLRMLVVFFSGLAMYNATELILMVFWTFRRYKGAYFWSLLISSGGIIPYSLGFLFKYMRVTTGDAKWFAVVLLTSKLTTRHLLVFF